MIHQCYPQRLTVDEKTVGLNEECGVNCNQGREGKRERERIMQAGHYY
jgi:hypothetical protein